MIITYIFKQYSSDCHHSLCCAAKQNISFNTARKHTFEINYVKNKKKCQFLMCVHVYANEIHFCHLLFFFCFFLSLSSKLFINRNRRIQLSSTPEYHYFFNAFFFLPVTHHVRLHLCNFHNITFCSYLKHLQFIFMCLSLDKK